MVLHTRITNCKLATESLNDIWRACNKQTTPSRKICLQNVRKKVASHLVLFEACFLAFYQTWSHKFRNKDLNASNKRKQKKKTKQKTNMKGLDRLWAIKWMRGGGGGRSFMDLHLAEVCPGNEASPSGHSWNDAKRQKKKVPISPFF